LFKMKFWATGWLIGYFVVMAPISLAFHHTSLVYALCHSIFGVGVAVVVEFCQRDRRYF